jgi:hypothetical protein
MAGVASWSFALMNKRPKLGSGESELNVHLWVGVTPRYFHSVALRMTSTVSSGMSHIGK